MIDYIKLQKIVKDTLSEKRYIHSEGVVTRALEYADIYNVDKETIKLVAIAHDIAKELNSNEIEECIKKYNIEIDEIENLNHNLLHAKLASYICKDRFGFTDEMCNAIKYHTTGAPNMTLLEKIIYLADATEPNRKYDSKPYVDTIKKDINQGMVDVSKWVISDIVNKDILLHPNTLECYNYYCKLIRGDINE